ncbi:sigma-70 family RNA polymerase sigma factor [Virgisporangium aurantiacum]
MTDQDVLARRFEADRPRLRSVAHRMLGSAAEADDAVQEAWLRLRRVDADTVDNLSGWLTTVVGRVCLDMLRSRAVRREDPLDGPPPKAGPTAGAGIPDPAQTAELADSVGVALLVVLETLTPTERLAFVLHDLFAVPFEEIAPIVGRTPTAARQLASRARRRVQSEPAELPAAPGAVRQRRVVEAFLAASRGGDFETLLTLLDPDVVLRIDQPARRLGAPADMHGRDAVARFFNGRARAARPAFVDGAPAAVVLAGGRPRVVIMFIVVDDTIIGMEAVADPEVIGGLEVVLT